MKLFSEFIFDTNIFIARGGKACEVSVQSLLLLQLQRELARSCAVSPHQEVDQEV